MKIAKTVGKLFNRLQNGLAQETAEDITDSESTSPKLAALCRKTAAEGAILLKNDGVLPISSTDRIAVFGRCAVDYFYVGYGSGGDVIAPYKVSPMKGFDNAGVETDTELRQKYENWCQKHEPDNGFWGHWPFCYDEMPIDGDTVLAASKRNTAAVVVIGRAAGEDRENKLKKGSYYLTYEEESMLKYVSTYFRRVAVVLDIGNIIDMSWIEKYKVGAVLLAWQGGMESGNALADVLTGKINPCGHLTDTIAKEYKDYPSSEDFGKKKFNNYTEDIYVGYRYFNTFEKDKVLYPFGYGLSYTSFKIECKRFQGIGITLNMDLSVKNIGKCAGKAVAQVYVEKPQGFLGNPEKILVCFFKSKNLLPGESQEISITAPFLDIASFDDSGVTGHKSCFVAEAGDYKFYAGNGVSDCHMICNAELPELIVLDKLNPVMPLASDDIFKRLTNRNGKFYEDLTTFDIDLGEKIKAELPDSIPQTGDKGYKLADVCNGTIDMDTFVAQLSLKELESITRGEGAMHSSFGTDGNAGMFGGTTKSLRDKGVPTVITTDGPSGIRVKKTCSLLPSGTLIASTWDVELIEELFKNEADEVKARGSNVLLAPGMNIHRNPLCGRNFEYFSEDPVLSGKIAASVVRGLQHNGVSACPKHFACNNQETNRNHNDSRVSERALREIYLKGFEICIKESKPMNIMTSYNKINGVWSHYNYWLCQTILRDEWKYEGNVMTDWWMRYTSSPEFPSIRGNAYRVRARVDLLMPGGKSIMDKSGVPDGTLLSSFGKKDGITLGEMQRAAKDVLSMAVNSTAMKK